MPGNDAAGNPVAIVPCRVVTRVRVPAARVWEVMKGRTRHATLIKFLRRGPPPMRGAALFACRRPMAGSPSCSSSTTSTLSPRTETPCRRGDSRALGSEPRGGIGPEPYIGAIDSARGVTPTGGHRMPIYRMTLECWSCCSSEDPRVSFEQKFGHTIKLRTIPRPVNTRGRGSIAVSRPTVSMRRRLRPARLARPGMRPGGSPLGKPDSAAPCGRRVAGCRPCARLTAVTRPRGAPRRPTATGWCGEAGVDEAPSRRGGGKTQSG
jgi:hypothetical protein